MTRFLRYGEVATLAALAEAIALLETMLGSLSSYPENLVLRVLDAFAANARQQIDARAADDVELRRLLTIVDLTLATLRGIVGFPLPPDPVGVDAVAAAAC